MPPASAGRVHPGGMAAAAGMRPGDSIAALDDLPVRSPAELQVALRSAGRDHTCAILFEREGETLEARVPTMHAPIEDGVLYDAALCDDRPTRLRTMIDPALSRDAPSKRPAILFVQGLSLKTMDFAYPDLFRAWRDEGFVTMRIEKRGVGDSEGDAPELGDFATEVADVRSALVALAGYDFVDPDAIFVFGHSTGGMIAPKLAADELVRGYVVFGSSAEPWFDCLEATARRQSALRGGDVEAAAVASREEMRARAVIDGRSAAYHLELHDAEIAAAWSRIERPVHVLHGEYDWVVGEDESRRIAALSGGSFASIPRVDHLFTAHGSVEESLNAYGKGRSTREVVRESCAWMRRVMTSREIPRR